MFHKIKNFNLLRTFIVDFPITVNIRLPDHLLDFFIREVLAQVRHHLAEFSGGDGAVSIPVEHSNKDRRQERGRSEREEVELDRIEYSKMKRRQEKGDQRGKRNSWQQRIF